jgi:hypothetical protein
LDDRGEEVESKPRCRRERKRSREEERCEQVSADKQREEEEEPSPLSPLYLLALLFALYPPCFALSRKQWEKTKNKKVDFSSCL